MWLVWWSLGLAVGGCVMYYVMALDSKQRIKTLLENFHELLTEEDAYPLTRGRTRKVIRQLLDEGW